MVRGALRLDALSALALVAALAEADGLVARHRTLGVGAAVGHRAGVRALQEEGWDWDSHGQFWCLGQARVTNKVAPML